MNNICKDCPRYMPGYQYTDGETWYTSHRCPGNDCGKYTGCVRKPYHPPRSIIGLVYNIDTEKWEVKKHV